ncbi:PREDICTED: uncharacterized protein LOC109130605 [Camelina sativa]|uniref:Uncharacterized protein LOC109130605 n=1 Tax=Camelina sativa TaxID=90675 RepID=A0ABM1RA30_CAMSA|nr:PREDICTED: uncharacterized protein LOC109130605 [Camelina sativa]
MVDDPLEMSQIAVAHFQSILGPHSLPPIAVSLNWLQSIIQYRCSSELKQTMIKLPTSEEIKRVMFKINGNKAPGPDGFTSNFYKTAWEILGSDVTGSIMHSFIQLSSRRLLKPVFPDLIQKNQTAFIKGRLLVENTLVSADLVNGYQKEKGPKRITIKVDIAKAFDTGDPLSPYLFVLVMNCLSVMLDKAAEEGKFKYHYKCQRLKLTHLCFADDLLIFTDGSLSSVLSVLQVLKSFEEASGLAISLPKTSFFASGLHQPEIDQIKAASGIAHGQLPIRYLGISLCTKKLTLLDCAPLIQRVKTKLNSWSTRTLSFAGRLQMLNTVIAGITNFWCSALVLPKKCIDTLNSLCGMFLWKGCLEGHHSARVAWSTVVTAKSEGGLGIRDLKKWNKACLVKLIWLLFFRSGSIWVAWFKEAVLAGNLSNFWVRKPNSQHSWIAKKLLKIREEAYPWIMVKLGNGRKCRFWSDRWCKLGRMSDSLSGDLSIGIPKSAVLADLWRRGNWRLPPARSEAQVSYQAELSALQLTEEEDSHTWWINDRVKDSHSTGRICSALGEELPSVPWHKIVWTSGGIPKHNFLTWLVVLNRCPTRDRLLQWGLQVDSRCLLCAIGSESRDHLFFNCPYSWSLWSKISRRCNHNSAPSWTGTMNGLINYKGSREARKLLLIAWQALIYFLWTERNHRLHRNCFKPADHLLHQVDQLV